MIASTSAKHRELRARKAKTFSPVGSRMDPACAAEPANPAAAIAPEEGEAASPAQAEPPSYDEIIRAYSKERLEKEEKRKKKAEERKAKEKEKKLRKRELKAKKRELRLEVLGICEAINKEMAYKKRHEGELVERIVSLRKRINAGLPADERRSERLRLEGLKDQLSQLQKGSIATLLKLRAEKAVLKAKLDELKGKGDLPRAPGELCPVLVIVDDRSRYTYALRILPSATTEDVLEVLKEALPPTIRYIITDNGTQFTADDFEEFCAGKDEVLHVRIYAHHPNENGRVERHIRTVKDLLELREWNNEGELDGALQDVRGEINSTPHQGLKYLTPAEYHSGGELCKASA
jgi:transposase InsO family protein